MLWIATPRQNITHLPMEVAQEATKCVAKCILSTFLLNKIAFIYTKYHLVSR